MARVPGNYPPQPDYSHPSYPPQSDYPPQNYPPQPGYPPAYGQSEYPPASVQPPQPYYQPAPVYAPPVTTVMIVTDPNRSDIPIRVQCPSCGHQDFSRINYISGSGTWIVCICLCAFGFFPFNYLPFCLDPCKDKQHLCGKCGAVVGYKPLFS